MRGVAAGAPPRTLLALAAAVVVLGGAARPADAQIGTAASAQIQANVDTMGFYKALDLESNNKFREAAPLFRAALHTPQAVNAMLGLERVYAQLGWTDSLVAPIDSMIAASPREETYRTVQLRTLQTLGRDADLRAAFERWVRDMPNSAVPYRAYADLLIDHNQAAAADSVLARAAKALGSTNDLALEVAQTRAAEGQWVESARAWREALAAADYLEQAAAYALAPTPSASRQAVREVFLGPPPVVSVRRALADLETTWGSPADGWDALKDLPPDSVAADAWSEFATRAESEERWTVARAALESALRWRHTPALALRAANAALETGDPAGALRLAPLGDAGGDSARIARDYVPLHVRALAALARPQDAEQLVAPYDHFLTPAQHDAVTRTIALGWVRTGDMPRARAALAAAGTAGDSSQASGWLALYEGNLKAARALLRAGDESTPELAAALALIARLHSDTSVTIGRAFLALAKNDSAGAAAQFVVAADSVPPVRSLLLLTAAEIQARLHHQTIATALWRRIVEHDATSPEAPQAELQWARALRQAGDAAGAQSHLEHMILTYPESSLVPQARRELELLKGSLPPS